MFANKYILLSLLILVFIGTGCIPSTTPPIPTTRPEPTLTPIQQQPTSTVFIGIPPIHDPLIQSENESVEEFVARIAARDISYSRPLLIAFSQLENKNDLSFWVSSNKSDVQQCWLYQTDSNQECANNDLEKYLNDRTLPKIFFAFVHSDSAKSLFLIQYSYDGDEQNPTDYLRLILELKDGKWIEKSITSVY